MTEQKETLELWARAMERARVLSLSNSNLDDSPDLRDAAAYLCTQSRSQSTPSVKMAAKIRQQSAKIAKLQKQLPEGMQNCTFVFKECEKGHGWLTATNWVQHECPTCEFTACQEENERLRQLITEAIVHCELCCGIPIHSKARCARCQTFNAALNP